MIYICSKCGHEEIDDNDVIEWCEKCEDLTMEKKKLDVTLETISDYGVKHLVNCPKGCSELVFGHAVDVNFGNIYSDVVIIYCPICKYKEDVFTK
jgi:hypothetical protein